MIKNPYRNILIIIAITLIGAIIVIAVFINLLNKKSEQTPEQKLDAIAEIEKRLKENSGQATDANSDADPGQNPEAGADEATENSRLVLRGNITAIYPTQIIIATEMSKSEVKINLGINTAITYSNKIFDKNNFMIGDLIEASGLKNNNGLEAESIKVIISTSPRTTAPEPNPANIRPDGSIRPL